MIRFTWRQFRPQALVGLCGLVLVGLVLAITWPRISQFADVFPAPTLTGFNKFVSLAIDMLVVAIPGLVGIFWGAPLVSRELETGTISLSWSQSVTRARWLGVKLGLTGLGCLLLAGLFSLMGTLWSGPIDQVHADQFSPLVFAARGIVPLGYAAFAFMLGVTMGVVIQRTQPAMVATLAVFAAMRAAVTYWVRPHFASPAHLVFDLTSSDVGLGLFPSEQTVKAFVDMPDSLIMSSQIVDGAGHPLPPQAVAEAFPGMMSGTFQGESEFHAGIAKLADAYHVLVSYQPPDRYWTFQAAETAMFLALAVALALFCAWWVRRRLT